MALLIDRGFVPTPISGNPILNLPREGINFKADYRILSASPTELILTNVTGPADRPERLRYAITNIANVYAGSTIDPQYQSPSKQGISLVAQHNATLMVSDPTIGFCQYLPYQAHTVLRIPLSAYITPLLTASLLARQASMFFETGLVDSGRINALTRGILRPADM